MGSTREGASLSLLEHKKGRISGLFRFPIPPVRVQAGCWSGASFGSALVAGTA